MARIARQLTDLVGNTPLLEFSNFNASKGLKAQVIGKLEYFNPAGSVKDRIALAMIEDAEAKGLLNPALPLSNRPAVIPESDSLLSPPRKATN